MDIEKTKLWTNINLGDLLDNPRVEEKRSVLFENFSNEEIFNITKDLAIEINKLESPDTICATEVKLAGFSRSTRIPLVCKTKETLIVLKLIKNANAVDKALVQLQRITDLIEEQLSISEVYMTIICLSDDINQTSQSYLETLIRRNKVCITTLKYLRNKIQLEKSINFLTSTGIFYDGNN